MKEEQIKEILKSSINSAIGIDDEFVEPYRLDVADEDGRLLSSKLYDAFHRDLNCTLSLFRYSDFDDFSSRAFPLLNNKDLLLLDWQLKGEGVEALEDVIRIISHAVSQDSPIRFIVIYTSVKNLYPLSRELFTSFMEKKDFEERINSIKAEVDEVLISNQEEIDADVFEKIVKDNLYGCLIEKNREVAKKQINTSVCSRLSNNNSRQRLNGYSHQLDDILIWLEMSSCSEMAKSIRPSPHIIQVLDEDVLLIDNTAVFLVTKPGVERQCYVPDVLVDHLCSKLKSLNNWRSLLLSLKIKEMMSQELSFVGKGLGGIKDSALKYYVKTDDASAAIASISDCFSAQISEGLRRLDKSFITTLWEGFDNDLKPTLVELGRLNRLLSFNPHHLGEPHRLQTGDVFKARDLHMKQGDEEEVYLMCITQSCDCLRPKEKVYNTLAFVVGKGASLKHGLEKAQEEFFSFVDNNFVIEWENHFFTVFIPEDKLDFKDSLDCLIVGLDDDGRMVDKSVVLHYLGHQKEVYAQRVINAVFSHAMRIGIDLPQWTNSE